MKKIATIGFLGFTPMLAFAVNLTDILGIFRDLINTILPIIIALALLYFFWGLAQFVLAAGDETKQGEAKSIMIWGIIALFVMISVWGLVNVLVDTFGLDTVAPTILEVPVIR